MPSDRFTPQTLYDYLFDFEQGVNNGKNPLILPKNQMSDATNVTVRGTFASHRPAFRKFTLDFGGDVALQAAVENGLWQGACYYKPDGGAPETLVAAIGGRLFQFIPAGTSAQVIEITIPGDPNPPNRPQAWLWQSEKWVIWMDGISVPVFFDGTVSRRSLVDTAISFNGLTAANFVIPAVGSSVAITLNSNINSVDNVTVITVAPFGTFLVTAGSGTPNITALNLTAAPVGATVTFPVTVTWTAAAAELPPGRMGVYGMGRNWISLPDGKQFIASDIVGGSSGSFAENFRDSVLKVSENTFLAGGGNFTVPGNTGNIRAMRFTATLDASLGQGPLQILTPNNVFSCNAPVDRLTWQDLTNPILTESLITNGGLSQNSTVVANGDLIFRAVDGIRSLILGRRDFETWGNVPISNEVDDFLRHDDRGLLAFSTAVIFDNRLLMSAAPVLSPGHGVYWKALIPLNFDPTSSLRGKAPSVYDSTMWTGLNTLQLVLGQFGGIERCFDFTLNTITNTIELYELLVKDDVIYDNDVTPITWEFETAQLDFGQRDPRKRELLRLMDGEIYVDDVQGQVDFQAWYKPDQYPCWIPWHQWSECALKVDTNDPNTANYKPQFRPRMGLGEPDPIPCESTTNRPFREAYLYQFKMIITGHCEFLGAKFKTVTCPEPAQMAPRCTPICPPV